MAVKEPTGGLKKACWKGYTAVGMKMKNGRKVPNCVPVKEESNEPKDREWGTTKLTKRYKKDTPGQCDCNTMKEEVEKQTHLVKVTVSEPSLKSAEPMLKGVRVRATSEGEAIKRAKSHFRKAGYKVHDAYHHSTITTVKKAGQMDEAATSDNTGYGKGYHGNIGGDDKKYSSMHTKVKRLVGAAGHLSDVKKPNVMVKHFLDSAHGRHIADQPSDTNITSRFKKFKKTYNPEMHESIDEGLTKAINKKMKNTLSAMRGRAALGAPEKGLSWQQNKAKAVKAGRAMAKEEVEQMEEGTRDLTAALAKKIEKKTGGKETAVRNKAGLLVTKKKSKDKFEEAFKLSPKNSLKYREHKHEYEREEQIKNKPSYQGYHTQIHVDGRHYKAGDRMGAGEKGAQDAGRHAANIAKKTGKKVSLHMIHHETGKTLAIADHEDGKWKYRNLSEAAPIQKQPKAGVEKLVSKMNPDTKAKTVSETRNIIREVIKKAVDKQETNKANGKTATGEPAPKIQIDPVIDLGANNRGIGGT